MSRLMIVEVPSYSSEFKGIREVAELIRCKECRHWHREINEDGVEYVHFSKCTKGHYGNGLDFYCADGERRES